MNESDLSLIEVWSVLWGSRYRILLVTFLTVLISLLVAYSLEDRYRAQAILAPVQDDSDNFSSPQLGIAASLTGLRLDQPNPGVRNAIAIIQSRQFIRDVIEKNRLGPYLVSSNCTRESVCSVNPSQFDVETNTWQGEFSESPPSDWELYKIFSEILNVSENAETGLVSISIEWPDPRQAADWTNLVVEEINERIKLYDLEEANSAIEYLTQQAASTQLVDMQRVFYQLIEGQMRVVMLADVREEYVFRVIDPAVIAEEPIYPNRVLIVLVAMMLSFFFCCAYFLARRILQGGA